MIDLATALPTTTPCLSQALSEGLSRLSRDADLVNNIRENRPFGSEQDRRSGANWLSRRFGTPLDPSSVVLTNGTQSALLWILQSETRPGDILVAEQLAYLRLRPVAQSLGLRVVGVDMDEEGIVPDALEVVCRQSGPKALFCTPTLQNPTLAVMSSARRLEIAKVARTHDLLIVEDDVLGLLHPDAPPPLHSFAPERSYYILSLSKSLAMGLRLAYVILPSYRKAPDADEPFARASYLFPNALSCELTNLLIETDRVDGVLYSARLDIEERQKIARYFLGRFLPRFAAGALHVWLPVKNRTTAEVISNEAFRRGVALRAASIFSIGDRPAPNALRVAVTAPKSLDVLAQGLEIVAEILCNPPKAETRGSPDRHQPERTDLS
ncbi:PLP-dependent aminotransferase family protein [Agrobacterium rhizogenes]|uniref:aminotransferase-like domain-containing protein n=1 Tax=Rhizobium rhizogenes TaxID=359 RepID=UPI0022B6F91C|nr:PLP-dependent aminotransferase family protein [Rhizobium rhizogenes]MCZ7450276.1 PLP-dependent aminotransferase family protein [Rhizobium rhizogenes]